MVANSQRVESALRDHDSVAADLSSSVETIKELKSAAIKQLEVERNGRLALEAQLRKAEESVHDSDQLAAQLAELSRRVDQLMQETPTLTAY